MSEQPSDAAVDAANQILLSEWTEVRPMPILIREVRAALEAAYRVDAFRALLDRDALTAGFMAFRERNGGCPEGPDCAACRSIAEEEADVALDLARPMPTRDQIVEALRTVDVLDYVSPPAEKSLSGSERGRVADALLDLMNGDKS